MYGNYRYIESWINDVKTCSIIFPYCNSHYRTTWVRKEGSIPRVYSRGYYSGHFIYLEDTVFDAFVFNADTFREVASGGVMHQKFPCIVEGTYVIEDGNIDFLILKYPEEGSNRETEILLTGSYDLQMSGDSLECTNGDGRYKQKYKMKNVPWE